MKIAQLLGTATYAASGPTYSCLRLSQHLARAGEEVWLLSQQGKPLAREPRFIHQTFPKAAWGGPLWHAPAMRRALFDLAPDVVHANGMWLAQGAYAAAYRRARPGAVLAVSPRGSLAEWAMRHRRGRKALFWRLFQHAALARADLLHATAESELADIRRHGFRQPVAVIPNGVDLPNQPASSAREVASRRLLFLARLHPVKGLAHLLDAWMRLAPRHPAWTLAIAGPPELASGFDLSREIGQRQLERIEVLGPVFGEAKAAAYRSAELYVLPTFTENFGLTIAEALAHGIPVVTTRGAPWQALERERCGWWIDIGVEPLVAALEQALTCDAKALAAMGGRGRRFVGREFSWNAIAMRMIAAYRHVALAEPKPAFVHTD